MAAIKQNQQLASCPHNRKMLEVVIEFSTVNVRNEGGERLLGAFSLEVGDVPLSRIPDMLHRIMIWRIGREIDRRDAFERLAEGEQRREILRVMETCVIEDDSDLLYQRTSRAGVGIA